MRGNTLAPKKFTALTTVRAGLFIAMSLVLKLMFEVYIPLAGLPALRLSFATVPVMLCGIVCGPVAGFLAGGAADIINFIIKPAGGFFPGITLANALSGWIPGLIYKYMRNELNFNLLNTVFTALLSGGCIGVMISKGALSLNGSTIMWNGSPLNSVFIVGSVLIVAAYIAVPIYLTRIGGKGVRMNKMLFTVSITQLITSIIMNTYFLSLMYGQGILVFLPGRILSNFLMIPLYTIILTSILNALGRRVFKMREEL